MRSAADFNQLGEDQLPFSLALQGGEEILMTKILRKLPRKRIVAFASWKDTEVVAKVFFGKLLAKRRFESEIKGNRLLNEHQVLTPKILFSGRLAKGCPGYIVIYEKIQPLASKENVHIQALVSIIAKANSQGLYFDDPHPDNFIFSEKGVYVLDAAQIMKKKQSMKRDVNNLALLLSQYCSPTEVIGNRWPNNRAIRERIEAARNKIDQAREKRFLKKIFRMATHFFSIKKWNMRAVFFRPGLQYLPETIADVERVYCQGEFLKKGNTCSVFLNKTKNNAVVVKRYNLKNISQRIKRLFETSRAEKSWKNAFLLEFNHIVTPKPLAMIEERFFFLKGRSYFISEYVSGERLDLYFSKTPADEINAGYVEQIKALFNQLEKRAIYHGDTKASNFILSGDKIFLLDLDSMKKMNPLLFRLKKAHQKDVKRFLENWNDYPKIKKQFEAVL